MLKQKASRIRLQFKFNWKIALGLLFLFSVLIRLGFWQLDRAEQKRQIQNDRDAWLLAKPVPVESLTLDNKNALKYVKVKLNGSYDNDKSVLISNQVFQNRHGYEVITAFKLDTSNQIVLVSRGWIAADFASRQLPAIEAIIGTHQLTGEIHLPSSNSFFLPKKIKHPIHWPLRLHHLDISSISPLFDKTVLPFVVRLEKNNPGVLKRHWQVTRLKPENSTSYAIQWFGMALILVVITVVKSTNILKILHTN